MLVVRRECFKQTLTQAMTLTHHIISLVRTLQTLKPSFLRMDGFGIGHKGVVVQLISTRWIAAVGTTGTWQPSMTYARRSCGTSRRAMVMFVVEDR